MGVLFLVQPLPKSTKFCPKIEKRPAELAAAAAAAGAAAQLEEDRFSHTSARETTTIFSLLSLSQLNSGFLTNGGLRTGKQGLVAQDSLIPGEEGR
jgi:hypothetical protein